MSFPCQNPPTLGIWTWITSGRILPSSKIHSSPGRGQAIYSPKRWCLPLRFTWTEPHRWMARRGSTGVSFLSVHSSGKCTENGSAPPSGQFSLVEGHLIPYSTFKGETWSTSRIGFYGILVSQISGRIPNPSERPPGSASAAVSSIDTGLKSDLIQGHKSGAVPCNSSIHEWSGTHLLLVLHKGITQKTQKNASEARIRALWFAFKSEWRECCRSTAWGPSASTHRYLTATLESSCRREGYFAL